MLGTFSEAALLAYAEQVVRKQKERQVKEAVQGTESHDNDGVGPNDKSFLETDESQDPSDYSEHYDFTTCIRANGTLYGTGGKCRKGTEIGADAVARLKQERKSPKQKQREGIQKRGEKAVTRARAEKVLGDLQKAGATEKKATERRAEKGKGNDREEQVRRVRAKAFLTMDRLRQKAKKMVPGQKKQQVEARIARLQAVLGRLDKTQKALRDAKPKMEDGFGKLPDWATTGRQLG